MDYCERCAKLETLLRRGRQILRDPDFIRVRGNLIGQIQFGEWSETVDDVLGPDPEE